MLFRYAILLGAFLLVPITALYFPVRLLGAADRPSFVTAPELAAVFFFGVAYVMWAARFFFNAPKLHFGLKAPEAPLPLMDKALLLALGGAASIGVFAAAKYAFYNYEIGTMEANLIQTGLALFRDPAQSYPDPVNGSAIAYMYPPLVSAVSGFLFDVFDHSFAWARGASVVLSLATGGILLSLYKGDNDKGQKLSLFLVWLTVPIYFSAYPYTVRPDAYLVFFTCASVALLGRYLARGNMLVLLLSAVAMGLAILAKHHAAVVLVTLAVCLLAQRQVLAAVLFGAVAALLVVVPLWILDGETNHWLMKTMLLGKSHGLRIAFVGGALTDMPLALLIAGSLLFVKGRPAMELARNPVFMALIGSVPLAVLAHAKGGYGSYTNYLVPVALALPLVWGSRPVEWRRLIIIAFVIAGPTNLMLRTYAPFHKIAPVSAAYMTKLVAETKGPIMLARRQGFLLANDRVPEDDIGDAVYEFAQAGIMEPTERIKANILSGRYEIIASNREHELLGSEVVQYLFTHYNVDTTNEVFDFLFTRKAESGK
ncbi:MAG: hypothetical protein EP335_08555 [Alphaproteobacteria bacterium]|nr:MAG: hypothetical protein EP335_08555 [Alphaproteobacteria bacterium]